MSDCKAGDNEDGDSHRGTLSSRLPDGPPHACQKTGGGNHQQQLGTETQGGGDSLGDHGCTRMNDDAGDERHEDRDQRQTSDCGRRHCKRSVE